MATRAEADAAVLVPESNSGKTLTCLRSLGRRDIHTILATERGTFSASRASKYVDEALDTCTPHDDLQSYTESLLECASRPDVATVVPNREEDAYVLSRHRPAFADHVEPIWPSFETIRTVQDGLELAAAAEAANVPVPETQSFDDVTDWDRNLIVKMRYSCLTAEYVDFLDETECEGQAPPLYHGPGAPPDRDAVVEHMLGHVPVVQEHIPIRDEYSFRALYDHGTPVATSVRRQIRGTSYAGGTSVYRELVENERVETLGKRLLDHLDWHGLATVQFIESADTGAYRFLEINPRTWTSIPLDVRAQADFPYFYWLLATGHGDEIDPSHETDFGSHLLYGELQYLWSVLSEEYPNTERPGLARTFFDVARSLVEQPRSDYLVRDDPMPFLFAVRNQLARA